jgi:hypothetical protein
MLKYHIQTVELTSAQASIVLTGIPQDYTDLIIQISARSLRSSTVDDAVSVKLNGTTANFTNRVLQGDGSAVQSATGFFGQGFFLASCAGAGATANTFGSATVYIPNYISAANKSISSETTTENNGTASTATIIAGVWANTAPVTNIVFDNFSGTNFIAGTSISLYGVRRGDDRVTKVSPVAIGGTVSTSGGYTIHTFNSSGTLVAYRPVEVEYLVVAGGGSGGGNGAIAHGAGGAGGYRSSVSGESSGGGVSAENKLSLTGNSSYVVTVGAGGSGVTQTSGSSSSLDTVTSIGGGRGGSTSANDGLTGGSGGGAGYAGSAFGSGTTGQGFAGGTGSSPSGGVAGGGGGGGAGQVGGNTNSSNAGNGGNGVSSLITGSSVTRGGGGGGGSYNLTVGNGGSGGGGAGGNHVSISPVNGTSNTGGGGGAAGGSGAGGNGGSGVVIIRYLTP